MMRRRATAAAAALILAGPQLHAQTPPRGGPSGPDEFGVAVLQGLDKITARITTIDAPVGKQIRFGTLRILVRRCHKRPPEETPETTAYLVIEERRSGEAPTALFSGWMFASSPAVSALEHPVYDVWVIDCKKSESSG